MQKEGRKKEGRKKQARSYDFVYKIIAIGQLQVKTDIFLWLGQSSVKFLY